MDLSLRLGGVLLAVLLPTPAQADGSDRGDDGYVPAHGAPLHAPFALYGEVHGGGYALEHTFATGGVDLGGLLLWRTWIIELGVNADAGSGYADVFDATPRTAVGGLFGVGDRDLFALGHGRLHAGGDLLFEGGVHTYGTTACGANPLGGLCLFERQVPVSGQVDYVGLRTGVTLGGRVSSSMLLGGGLWLYADWDKGTQHTTYAYPSCGFFQGCGPPDSSGTFTFGGAFEWGIMARLWFEKGVRLR